MASALRSAADMGCGTGLFAAHLAQQWRLPVFVHSGSSWSRVSEMAIRVLV
jgi:hypothetical protein